MMLFRPSIIVQENKPDGLDQPAQPDRPKGFTYSVGSEQILEYRTWPQERRLKWLFWANKMRKCLPPRTIEFQEAFRQGKI
jgi:hypothetical protein